MVALTYFYDDGAPDVDNLVKPVLDALKGLAFIDDEQVTDLLVRKRNLSGKLKVDDATPIMAAGFDLGRHSSTWSFARRPVRRSRFDA